MFIASMLCPNVARITRRSGAGNRSVASLCTSGSKASRRCSSRDPLTNGAPLNLIARTPTGADKADYIVGPSWHEGSQAMARLDDWKVEVPLLADPPQSLRGRRPANAPRHTSVPDHVATGEFLETPIFQFGHGGNHDLLRRRYIVRITKLGYSGVLVDGIRSQRQAWGCRRLGMGQDLASDYALLLGLDENWKVEDVTPDMVGKKARIRVGFRGGKVICPCCAKSAPRVEFLPERTWRHLDTMQFETELRALVPRANCGERGVMTGVVPWAGKHSPFTWLFEVFAVQVPESEANVKTATEVLGFGWDAAHRMMERTVERGLAEREVTKLRRAGIDEKSFLGGRTTSRHFAICMACGSLRSCAGALRHFPRKCAGRSKRWPSKCGQPSSTPPGECCRKPKFLGPIPRLQAHGRCRRCSYGGTITRRGPRAVAAA